MHPHKILSSYLVRPDLSPRRQRQWAGFRTQWVEIHRHNPRAITRGLGALLIWTVVIGSIRYIDNPASLNLPASVTSAGITSHAAVTQTTPFPVTGSAAALATVAHAAELPGGPSGQLLPPGTMAPDKTYRNTYTWGNCTWYVAGRRQIPNNWGNARSWYYNANSSGWSVGTTPAVAAIAWTGAASSNRYLGHVALVEKVSADGKQVYISEMNYRGLGVKSFRWVSASNFKYIY